MSKADLRERLRSMALPQRITRPTVITHSTVARWLGKHPSLLKHLVSGRAVMTDRVQLRLTQFFALLDAGKIEMRQEGHKRIMVPTDPMRPKPIPPVKTPHIDFASMKMVMR